MLEALCLSLILVGAIVLGWSGARYYRTFAFMRVQIYDRQVYNNFVCGMAFILTMFVFAGYISIVSVKRHGTFDPEFLLVASVFFLGALVVMCMGNIQQKLMGAIVDKRLDTIHSMIRAIEAKDIYTKGHSEHVYQLVELIYHRLPGPVRSRINLVKLKDAAMLHDIGKIGTPDSILNKTGPLTDEDWAVIRQHPERGKHILEKTSFREICDVVLYHHERMDGRGYYGVPADRIPLESRIIAVADTFSALYADRVYRKKYSFDEALAILRLSAGTQLDPLVVDTFCRIPHEEIDTLFAASDGKSSYCLFCKPSLMRNSVCLRMDARRNLRLSSFSCPRA